MVELVLCVFDSVMPTRMPACYKALSGLADSGFHTGFEGGGE